MANLFKIKEIARSKKISLRSLAEDVGISEQGLQKLIRTNTAKIETIELIAKRLEVPVGVFFDDPKSNVGHSTTGDFSPINGNITIEECRSELEIAKVKIAFLEKSLEDKERIIELLSSKI